MSESDDRPYAAILAADDWRPLEEYEPSAEYVYVKGFAYMARAPHVVVARRGRHQLSYWYAPSGPCAIGATHWKPTPDDGMSPYDRERWLYGDQDGAFVRPAEPVYEPGGTDVRLTPVPAALLASIGAGARLHERAWRWTEWRLRMPGREPERIGERGINSLRRHAFIARDGVLPPGRLPRWFEFDWSITDAGKAWLAADR
jgi:hypothetical protein